MLTRDAIDERAKIRVRDAFERLRDRLGFQTNRQLAAHLGWSSTFEHYLNGRPWPWPMLIDLAYAHGEELQHMLCEALPSHKEPADG